MEFPNPYYSEFHLKFRNCLFGSLQSIAPVILSNLHTRLLRDYHLWCRIIFCKAGMWLRLPTFYPCVNANASFMCKGRKKSITACKWLGYKAVLSNITTCLWKKPEMFVYGNWTAALPFWNSIISKNKVHGKGNVIWKRFLFVLAILTTRFIFKKAMCDFMYLRLHPFCDGIRKCPFTYPR